MNSSLHSARSTRSSVDVVVRQAQDVLILELTGKILGGPESEGVRREVDRILLTDINKVLVNLEGVPWMNSAGLGILLSGFSRLRDRGGRMGFCGVRDRVREILETTKLVTVLEVFADESAGLRALGVDGNPPRGASASS
jgi:anti-sigma B factor antagonist